MAVVRFFFDVPQADVFRVNAAHGLVKRLGFDGRMCREVKFARAFASRPLGCCPEKFSANALSARVCGHEEVTQIEVFVIGTERLCIDGYEPFKDVALHRAVDEAPSHEERIWFENALDTENFRRKSPEQMISDKEKAA